MTTFYYWGQIITWLSAALYSTQIQQDRTSVLGLDPPLQQKYRHFASQSIDLSTEERFLWELKVIFVIYCNYLHFSYCPFHWHPSLVHLQDCPGDFLNKITIITWVGQYLSVGPLEWNYAGFHLLCGYFRKDSLSSLKNLHKEKCQVGWYSRCLLQNCWAHLYSSLISFQS